MPKSDQQPNDQISSKMRCSSNTQIKHLRGKISKATRQALNKMEFNCSKCSIQLSFGEIKISPAEMILCGICDDLMTNCCETVVANHLHKSQPKYHEIFPTDLINAKHHFAAYRILGLSLCTACNTFSLDKKSMISGNLANNQFSCDHRMLCEECCEKKDKCVSCDHSCSVMMPKLDSVRVVDSLFKRTPTCPICFEEQSFNDIIGIYCGHCMCVSCWQRHCNSDSQRFRESPECPLCRNTETFFSDGYDYNVRVLNQNFRRKVLWATVEGQILPENAFRLLRTSQELTKQEKGIMFVCEKMCGRVFDQIYICEHCGFEMGFCSHCFKNATEIKCSHCAAMIEKDQFVQLHFEWSDDSTHNDAIIEYDTLIYESAKSFVNSIMLRCIGT